MRGGGIKFIKNLSSAQTRSSLPKRLGITTSKRAVTIWNGNFGKNGNMDTICGCFLTAIAFCRLSIFSLDQLSVLVIERR